MPGEGQRASRSSRAKSTATKRTSCATASAEPRALACPAANPGGRPRTPRVAQLRHPPRAAIEPAPRSRPVDARAGAHRLIDGRPSARHHFDRATRTRGPPGPRTPSPGVSRTTAPSAARAPSGRSVASAVGFVERRDRRAPVGHRHEPGTPSPPFGSRCRASFGGCYVCSHALIAARAGARRACRASCSRSRRRRSRSPASRCSFVGWSCRIVTTVFLSLCSSNVIVTRKRCSSSSLSEPWSKTSRSGGFDLQEHDPVVPDLAVGRDHVEAPAPADAHVALVRRRRVALRAEPLREVLRVRPRREDELARRIEDARQHDLRDRATRGPHHFLRRMVFFSFGGLALQLLRGTRRADRSARSTRAACAGPTR